MPLDDMKALADELKGEVKSTYEELHKKNGDLAEQIDLLKEKIADDADLTDIKTRIDEQKDIIEKQQNSIDEAEKKWSRSPSSNAAKSISQMIVESEEFKNAKRGDRGSWSHTVEAKEIANLSNYQVSPDRNVLVPEMVAPFLQPLDQPLGIRSLFPSASTNSDVIQRTEEDVFTNNADTVAEGALKPESDITFKRGSLQVEKIAHWIRATDEVLSDAGMLRGYIENRLRYGVNFKEEEQLLNGDGVSPNLDGVLNAGNFTAYDNTTLGAAFTPSDGIDDVRIGVQQVNNSYLPATAVVMHPNDWARIELQKDADGRYLWANVQSGATPRLWGMPVVQSYAIAQGNFLCGSFRMGGMIWDRWALRVSASNEDRDNFVTNKVTILAEKRLALEIMRPTAFVYGALS